MVKLGGINSKYREYLSLIMRKSSGPVSADSVKSILSVSHKNAQSILIRLTQLGWLIRIKKDLYTPSSISSADTGTETQNPWVLANHLFSPCYIGGWDAVSHWNFTDQIFEKIFVYTTSPQRKVEQNFLGYTFIVRKIAPEDFFGLTPIWKGKNKLLISDPSKTIIDLLDSPDLYGGIRNVCDIFLNYTKSEHFSLTQLVEYALKEKNKTVAKRVGFLMDLYGIQTIASENKLLSGLSKGRSKLDPLQKKSTLVSKWNLLVPPDYKREHKRD